MRTKFKHLVKKIQKQHKEYEYLTGHKWDINYPPAKFFKKDILFFLRLKGWEANYSGKRKTFYLYPVINKKNLNINKIINENFMHFFKFLKDSGFKFKIQKNETIN